MKDELKLAKFIVFTVADYHFALPIGEVIQVVNYPETTRELRQAGLVQIGRHVIRILDLQQQLSLEEPPADRPLLIITQSLPGELCAIPVSAPPDLIEVPLDLMQLLPQSDAPSSVLRIASHAATLSHEGIQTTVFLLNLRRMLIPIAMLR